MKFKINSSHSISHPSPDPNFKNPILAHSFEINPNLLQKQVPSPIFCFQVS